jgi:hypothetical protein
VKVPYVEDKTTEGGSNSPSDSDLTRMIRAEVDTWTPRRGPDWTDVLIRIAGTGPSPWLVYTTASAALVVILIAAYLVGTALQLGALAPPAQVHLH